MNPGDLRQQIIIQVKRAPVVQDTFGEEQPIWDTFATIWAGPEALRGQEYLEARRLQADVDWRVRIRFLAGITPSMRVIYGDKILNIVSVIDVKERHREIQLMCKELVNGK
jgi:SPP1 family predicted phage head-tail adaptor